MCHFIMKLPKLLGLASHEIILTKLAGPLVFNRPTVFDDVRVHIVDLERNVNRYFAEIATASFAQQFIMQMAITFPMFIGIGSGGMHFAQMTNIPHVSAKSPAFHLVIVLDKLPEYYCIKWFLKT